MKTAVCRVESLLSALPRDKATAQQQLDTEMARFQAVAGMAAARVENMRDLLVRLYFIIGCLQSRADGRRCGCRPTRTSWTSSHSPSSSNVMQYTFNKQHLYSF